MLRFLIFMANSLIFLSFIPFPSNLESRSISVVSYRVQRISSCACWSTDLAFAGLGGKGVVPILSFSMEESESS